MVQPPVVTDKARGAIGVDLNVDHLAIAETDSSGNWVRSWRVALVTYGKSRHQAEAIIGDAVASIVGYARDVGQPIVIEKLDLRQKKAVLEGESRKDSRMLSSLSYGRTRACFLSRGLVRKYRKTDVQLDNSTPRKSGLQFGHRPGRVLGAIRAQRTPGSGPGAGPAFVWLFRRHPAP